MDQPTFADLEYQGKKRNLKQRLGVNLLSLMAALREEGRLPFRTIQWYLRTVHQLRLSLGAIVGPAASCSWSG